MKNFSWKDRNKGQCVYCLCLKIIEITEEKINELGTEKDFYSVEVEKELCDNIEQPTGIVLKKILEWGSSNKNINLNSDDKKHIVKYIRYLLYRSDKFVQEINKESILSKTLGSLEKNELFKLDDIVPSLRDSLNKYDVNLIINNTDVNFVIPRNGFYQYKNIIIFPFSPRKALCLLTFDEMKKYISDGFVNHLKVDDNLTIQTLNKRALFMEKEMNNEFIIAKCKDELEPLLNLLKYID